MELEELSSQTIHKEETLVQIQFFHLLLLQAEEAEDQEILLQVQALL